ncbi:MAG: septum formation initiator family protein [Nitrospirae bacterium]|nr:septum formation initiator family protein [Nitrospirota bacterium]MBF0534999.1 septum formation initiator family protein [Nitrospirota bacterium]MBF0617149.1 septum formation initiator family protein [Nitrospirota bacterium]
MSKRNLLRTQIVKERKNRSRIFVFLFTIAFLLIMFDLVFDDMGVLRYMKLKSEEKVLESSISDMEKSIVKLKEDIGVIRSDPFYIEKQAREDLGLAKPDEYIFKYENTEASNKEAKGKIKKQGK